MLKRQIDEIVLVGGSAKIPKLRNMMTELFQKEPNDAIAAETAVVTGAAFQVPPELL